MSKKRIARIIIGCVIAIVVVIFVVGCNSSPEPTLLLTYQADLTGIEAGTEDETMDGVRTVIERRINALGIKKSSVQVQKQEDEYNIVIQAYGDFDLRKSRI